MLYFFLLYVKKKYILDRYEKEKKVIAYYVNNNERIMEQSNKALHEKYEFCNIRRDEIEQAVKIEAICFPPNEACTYEHMVPRSKMHRIFFWWQWTEKLERWQLF